MGNTKEDLPKKLVEDKIIREEILGAFTRVTTLRPLALESNTSESHFEEAARKTRQFNRKNKAFLEAFFSNKRYVREYEQVKAPESFEGKPLEKKRNMLVKMIDGKTEVLESILEQLRFLEYGPKSKQKEILAKIKDPKKIFLVHGHDEVLRKEVELYLRRIRLNPVILKDLPGKGRTLIEKFEDHSDVNFAVVLFTPDDLKVSKRYLEEYKSTHESVDFDNILKESPRSNVIFELGFFVSRLGRRNVCVIHVPGTDILSDYSGVNYISTDDPSRWQNRLAQELRAAGIDFDYEQALI